MVRVGTALAGNSVGESIDPIGRGCGFDAQSGHIQESTKECTDKWNNKLKFLSLSLSQIKKNF